MTHINSKILGLFPIAFILLAGCTGTAHIEKDKNTDLGKYKTYTWIDKENGKNSNHSNDIAEQSVRTSVNQELQKNGFREVKANPDLLLTYDLLIEKNVKQQNNPVYSKPYTRLYYNPYSGRYRSLYFPSQFMGYDNYETAVKEGTVTISMIDTKTDKTIWQGWSTNELHSNHLTSKDVQKNVKSIFKKFDVASR
jgi:Domain of unknown function (DUF4136)